MTKIVNESHYIFRYNKTSLFILTFYILCIYKINQRKHGYNLKTLDVWIKCFGHPFKEALNEKEGSRKGLVDPLTHTYTSKKSGSPNSSLPTAHLEILVSFVS